MVGGDTGDLVDGVSGLAEAERFGVALGTTLLGPPELAEGAAEAVSQHTGRRAGRAVIYPGVHTLTGTVRVGAILTGSAIGKIVVLAGQGEPAADDLVDTRDHVRPEWRDGVLTLTTTAVAPGRYAPFEVPNPTPCCADHA